MPRHNLWRPNLAHGIPTELRSLGRTQNERKLTAVHSDLGLERSNWESLDDSPGWLCLDLHLLTEGHPHSGLCGRFHAGFDPAEAWDGEDACLLHLRGCKRRQALKEACAHLGLHLMLLSKCPDKSALGHHFAGRLHGLHCLHALHGSHDCEISWRYYGFALSRL